ncbi:3-phosphoshikimate 1-carboxyvinyltransferase [Corynebacterium epidermidicanis]|nr:3-phosphoshikimate 1-carboxyvinyltransferase [Corynebacterium epidermidicanis]
MAEKVQDQWWQAPPAAGPIDWELRIPGSKSMTNRALVLAALADGPSVIHDALISRDTELMMQALEQLGTKITRTATSHGTPSTTIKVEPGRFTGGSVHTGLAGTIMRFLPPVAALADGTVFFDGDPEARVRPMSTTLEALRDLGVAVTGDSLPFTIVGTGAVTGGEVSIDASASSQFVSGLMLAGCRFRDGLTITHTGNKLPSLPHIELTVDMLQHAGISVTRTAPNQWHVAPGVPRACIWRIEPDLSNATPFLAAAAVTGGRVRIHDWPMKTAQPGDAIRDILMDMGCEVEFIAVGDGHALEIHGPHPGELRGLDLDLSDIGELTPTLAALAAVANSPSELHGIAHLRGHETDRLAALTAELNNVGVDCRELPDGLAIRPRPLRAGKWRSYADHRMATAGAILGLLTPIKVENIATTAKTLPGFATMWEDMVHHAAEPESGVTSG